jgi:hypothetical protein
MGMLMTKLEFIIKASNPYDYEAFKMAVGNEILPWSYFQTVGMVLGAKQLFPDKEPEEAYNELIRMMNAAYMERIPPKITSPVGAKESCGGCGGGKVR